MTFGPTHALPPTNGAHPHQRVIRLATALLLIGMGVTATAGMASPSTLTVPTVDKTVSGIGTGYASTTVTTVANELLVAFVGSDGATWGGQTARVTGGPVWTLVGRSNAQLGDAEIWTAGVVPAQTATKVTAQLAETGNLDVQVTVVSYKGASGVGATTSANGGSGASRVNLSTTQTGSLVYAVGADWDTATARTLGSGQTLDAQDLDRNGDTYWAQHMTAPAAAIGAVTVSDSAPTGDRWNLQAVEIAAATGSSTTTTSTGSTTTTVPATTTTVPATTTTIPATTTTTMPGGQQLVFADEFNGTSLDTNSWVALNRGGDASNSEQECYLPSNATVANGSLHLLAKVDSSCSGYRYTSAMVQWQTYNFLYGTLEVRALEPGGTTWPAEWLLGADCQQSNPTDPGNIGTCNWPAPGSDEIDIAEFMGGSRSSVNQQIHSNGNNSGCQPSLSDASQNWHTYDLVWAPGSLTWKVDGATTCHLTQGVPSHPMFLIMNTALGGAGGPVNDSSLPQNHAIDYVRVYQ
jgi:Glycosyl hydrolases family 16